MYCYRVKQLQTQLGEKEAMIKVYQRAAPAALPRSSSVHAICCSPHHSPRPSLIASTTYSRTPPAYSIKHVKTGVCSQYSFAVELNTLLASGIIKDSQKIFPNIEA
jgi:hypothetical protein